MSDAKSGVPTPNYTQVPNALLEDWLPSMKNAELKVVLAICRKTFGWHKDKDRISLTQLQEATGLSRQGVLNGLNDAIERGIVSKTGKAKAGYSYQLLVNEVDQPTEHNDLTSQRSRPPLVNEVDHASQRSRPPLVNEVDTQKKLKETKERKIKEKKSATATPLERKNGKAKRKRDPRLDHPAIKAYREVCSLTLEKELRDDVIDLVGDQPDIEKMQSCFKAWTRMGYKRTNKDWLFDWYKNGIPQRKNGATNGRANTNGRYNGRRQRAAWSTEELREHWRTTDDPF